MNLMKRNSNTWVDPFDVMSDLQDEFNRMFSGSLRRIRDREYAGGFFAPEIDLREENDTYILKADLPGVGKDDVQIQFTGNILEIKGEKKEESEKKDKGFYHAERRYGSFARVIEFPTEVQSDKVKATYQNGVLELTVPKAESAKPKQVRVELK